MGYPDSFEGFMIEDQKKWTEFKKKEVCSPGAEACFFSQTTYRDVLVQTQEIRGQRH